MSEKPDIYYDRLAKLSPEERAQLRTLLLSPLYVKLLRICAGKKPSPNCNKAGSYDRDEYSDARANARLGEIRGWEFYEACLFMALLDAPAVRSEPEESFPESGFLPLQLKTKKGKK